MQQNSATLDVAIFVLNQTTFYFIQWRRDIDYLLIINFPAEKYQLATS